MGIALVALWITAVVAVERTPSEPVAVTATFALWSDFETNLDDALVSAGLAERTGRTEPFGGLHETPCFEALAAPLRQAWRSAARYYAEAVSSGSSGGRERTLLRLDLSGVVEDDEWDDPAERTFVAIARGMRAAAAPAYEACRWAEQDRANRAWIASVLPLLDQHEAAIARRSAEAFRRDWEGLPFRVDVVRTVEWSGAHTINLRPPGAHVLVSSANAANRDPTAALEILFHEASHFLAGRGSALRRALGAAAEEAGTSPVGGDLVHAVHFYMTGEIVRQRLSEAGVAYTPYLFAHGLFREGGFHEAIAATWPAYLAGEATLEEAARDLVSALSRAAGAPTAPASPER